MNKSPGIDFVGSRMLIELLSVISEFVADLFIKSLNTGDVPQDWKLAKCMLLLFLRKVKNVVYQRGEKPWRCVSLDSRHQLGEKPYFRFSPPAGIA